MNGSSEGSQHGGEILAICNDGEEDAEGATVGEDSSEFLCWSLCDQGGIEYYKPTFD